MSDIVKTAKKRVLTFIEQHYNYITISLHDTTLWKTDEKGACNLPESGVEYHPDVSGGEKDGKVFRSDDPELAQPCAYV